MIKVTVWNENLHETLHQEVRKIYPNGIHGQIAGFLEDENIFVRTATLDMPEHGLTDEVLDDTDVLIWWAHMAHEKVSDKVVEKVYDRVNKGMGLIVLHAGHYSKIFRKLMGTSCTLKWCLNDRERIWCIKPSHEIARGIPEYFEIPEEEMYGERFDIPDPDEIIFLSWFSGGEVFRSGCTFTRGCGKIFYFRPGHEFNPTYYNENVQKIIKNAVTWAAPSYRQAVTGCPEFFPLEDMTGKNA